MVRVSFFYPHQEGAAFDMDYYLGKHIPMVCKLLGDACKGATVEAGKFGGSPKQPPTYGVIAHLTFDSAEAFFTAMKPHAAAVMADLPNYTTLKPVMQVSEVKA